MTALHAGAALVLSRKVDATPDPLALYERYAGPNTLLFETADAREGSETRSLIVTRSAARIEIRGGTVEVEALSENGVGAVQAAALRCGAYLEAQEDKRARFEFPPPGSDEDATEEQRLLGASGLDAIRALTTDMEVTGDPGARRLIAAGLFTYDFFETFEPLPAPQSDLAGLPDAVFWLAEEIIELRSDPSSARVSRVLFGRDGADPERGPAQMGLEHAVENCQAARRRAPPRSPSRLYTVPVEPELDMDDAEYERVVDRLKEEIRSGEVFQIVPSRTFSLPCSDAVSAYRQLRLLNPSPYMFFVDAGEFTLFGASPETAVKVSRQPGRRVVEISPIAGTRRRGFDEQGRLDRDLDGRIEVELRFDTKELAEHMMLVDLARNDVARVSEPGTRYVERLLDVERYSHVMHLVSRVQGDLRSDLDSLHAYRATMNMGTLVGAPKLRAAELLREHEATKRGAYGGGVGYVDANGELDTAIVIRSSVVREGRAYVRAGAGVVSDSVPEAEADETWRKASAVLQAVARSEKDGRYD